MIIFTRSSLVAVLCLAACTTPTEELDKDGGSRADGGIRSDGGVVDAGPDDSLCPELASLENSILNPNGTITSSNIQEVLRLMLPGGGALPLGNLVSIVAQQDAGACQLTSTRNACDCPQGGTIVADSKSTSTVTQNRAVATQCGLMGQTYSGRSCKRQTIQAPLTLTLESYQFSKSPQDGGAPFVADTQFSLRQTGTALTLVELPRQRFVVSDGSVTLQTDGNVPGPWKIFDRQGTWDCGTLANASRVCTGPAGATIPWTK